MAGLNIMCVGGCWQEVAWQQQGEPFQVDGQWWQVWQCPNCQRKRTIIRPSTKVRNIR